MLFGAEGKGVDVDARIRGAGVVLEGLHRVEVGTLTLGEAVLAVELELGRDDRVLTPAVQVKGRLRKHERAGIGHTRRRGDRAVREGREVAAKSTGGRGVVLARRGRDVRRTRHLEKTRRVDEVGGALGLRGTTERMDRRGKRINGVRVVEGLGTKRAEERLRVVEGRAVIDVGVGLHDPDELLARVVEVQLNLVRAAAHRLIAGELHLLDEVLVRVLGHLAALVRVQEHVVDVEGRRHQGLLVGLGNRDRAAAAREGLDGPQALTDGADIKVNLDLVVLQRDQRERKSRVAAVPEQQGDVERRLRESVTGSAHLGRAARRRARSRHTSERGVRDVGELRGVANHLEVTVLLLRRHRELVPDVHPVAVLAIDALATNLNLDLGNELLSGEIEPTGIDTVGTGSSGGHALVDLRERDLEVGAVAQISVTGDGARYTTSEVGLSRERLLDGLHRKVRVSAVRYLPKGNLGGSGKEDVLGAIGDELHETTSHDRLI